MPSLLLACAGPGGARPCPIDGPHAVVATTDYDSGALAAVPADLGCVADLLSSTSRDPLVTVLDDPSGPVRVLVGDRFGGDTVRSFVPGDYGAPESEFALPTGGNTHDAVRVDGRLAFSRYDDAFVTVVEPDGAPAGTVDLSAWNDPDGSPEADRFARVGDRLFLALQRLEREGAVWPAHDEAFVLELDGAAGVVAALPVGPNPRLRAAGDGLLVATGRFASPDGEVVRLDPDSGAAEVLATEADLGGDVWIALDTPAGPFLAALPFDAPRPSLLTCDGGTAELDGFASDAGVAPDGTVWIALRGDATGGDDALVVVDPVDCAELDRLEAFRLPPYALAFVP